MATENELLKATAGMHSNNSNGNQRRSSSSASPPRRQRRSDDDDGILHTGPMTYKPRDYTPQEFSASALADHPVKTFSHRVITSPEGHPLLAVGAAWDYIVDHELSRQGLVDLAFVGEYLRTRARCDGQGPVFSEKDVLDAIRLSTEEADGLL